MNDERLYIVAYDIADDRRWRQVFKLMRAYGSWIQLSVFQCRLSKRLRAELEARLRTLLREGDDHVLIIDVGPAERTELGIVSIGKGYSRIERRASII